MDVEEKGIVVEVRGARAVVRAVQGSQCAGCGSAKYCHGSGGEKTVEADNEIGAKAGDSVVMAVPSGALLQASFRVYILPVVGLLAGAGAMQLAVGRIAGPETAGMAAGIGGLFGAILSVVVLRLAGKGGDRGEGLRPRITRLAE
jgi:sigma-E factor negative regulatory protein RseC